MIAERNLPVLNEDDLFEMIKSSPAPNPVPLPAKASRKKVNSFGSLSKSGVTSRSNSSAFRRLNRAHRPQNVDRSRQKLPP